MSSQHNSNSELGLAENRGPIKDSTGKAQLAHDHATKSRPSQHLTVSWVQELMEGWEEEA
jgi:hypothetical protein